MKNLFLIIGIFCSLFAQSQVKTENLIVVGLDGMRWQEIFGGIDSSLVNDRAYTKSAAGLKKKYWDDDLKQRRKKLFPFIWGVMEQKGQLYGNRLIGNKMNVANPYQFTAPGFSEMLIGFPDSAVNTNGRVINKNMSVLEFINNQKKYKGEVAVFSTSYLFDYILDKERTGLKVNADADPLNFPSKQFELLNQMQQMAVKPTGERPDLLTYFAAREYLKMYKPKVLYFSLGETDAYAHAGSYDLYVETAHAEENMIASLWDLIQSTPGYKDKTTLVISCDHGRGAKIKSQWTGHGVKIEDSGEIFMAVMGPDTAPLGEVKSNTQIYQGQIAATMARLLGFDFTAPHPVMPAIESVFSK